MSQTPQAILSALQANQYMPLYFLQGSETYYIDLIAKYFAENVLSTAEQLLNLFIFYGKDQSLNTILTQARRYPIMAARQVIIVKEAQALQDLKTKMGHQLLAHYLEAPQMATSLVFLYKNAMLDSRTALSKLLAAHQALVDAKPLYDNQIHRWITAFVQQKRYTITSHATATLQTLVGNDLKKLSSELEKVMLNFSKGTTIEAHHIQQYVGMSKAYHLFTLQQALARKDKKAVYQHIQTCNHVHNVVIITLGSLFSFFNKLLVLHHAKDTSQQNLVKVLQIHPYFLNEYLIAANHYSLPKVIENIQHLYTADLHAKGIGSPPIQAIQFLQTLLFTLMSENINVHLNNTSIYAF